MARPPVAAAGARPPRSRRWWRLTRALPALVRWPNLAMMLLSLLLVRGALLSAPLWAPSFGELVVAALLVAAAGYIINDYYDVKIDAINRPDRLVVGPLLRRRTAMLAHVVLSAAGVALALHLGPIIGAVTLGAALLLWGYSARFKRLPLVGNLSIATLTAALVLLPELQLRLGYRAVWGYALAAFLLTVVREIVKDLEDMRGDAAHGCRTLPLVAGVARSKWVAGLFVACLLLLTLGATGQLLTERRWTLALWLLGLVALPLGWLARLLWLADRQRHYRALSRWCKGIMLVGVLSMLVMR